MSDTLGEVLPPDAAFGVRVVVALANRVDLSRRDARLSLLVCPCLQFFVFLLITYDGERSGERSRSTLE